MSDGCVSEMARCFYYSNLISPFLTSVLLVVDCNTVTRDTCSDDYRRRACSLVQTLACVIECSAIAITLKLKRRSRKTANNRKIQLKRGLKNSIILQR